MFKSAILASAITLLAVGPSAAAVTIKFEAFSSSVFNFPGYPVGSTTGSFEVTLPYVDYHSVIPADQLTNCSATYGGAPTPCTTQSLYSANSTMAVVQTDAVGWGVLGVTFFYYFDRGVFDRTGVFETTADSNSFNHVGRLTISGVADPRPSAPVPEPASWALLLMGFTALGSTVRASRLARVRGRT